jgi:hypothetical protein
MSGGAVRAGRWTMTTAIDITPYTPATTPRHCRIRTLWPVSTVLPPGATSRCPAGAQAAPGRWRVRAGVSDVDCQTEWRSKSIRMTTRRAVGWLISWKPAVSMYGLRTWLTFCRPEMLDEILG